MGVFRSTRFSPIVDTAQGHGSVGSSLIASVPSTARGVRFLNLEDETGLLNVVVLPQVWEIHYEVARKAVGVVIDGVIEHVDGVTNFVAHRFERWSVDGVRSRDFQIMHFIFVRPIFADEVSVVVHGGPMTKTFTGEVMLPGDAGNGLAATLSLDPERVTLTAGDSQLGSRDRADYLITPESNGSFGLTLGGETLVFRPDSPSEFSSTSAVPTR